MGTLYVGEQSTPTAGGVYTINSTSDGRTVASGVVVNSSTNLSVSGKFSATVVTNKVITLTYSSNTNVTVDASLGNKFYLLVTNSTTYFVTPLNLSPMQDISIILRQDGTGSRVISWTNQWVWSGGVVPGNTTNANAMDFYTGMVNPEGTNVGGVLTPNLR
jgi:hypothetical protein